MSQTLTSNQAFIMQMATVTQNTTSVRATPVHAVEGHPGPESAERDPRRVCNCLVTRHIFHLPLYAAQVFLEKRSCHRPSRHCTHRSPSWAIGIRTLWPRIGFVFEVHLARSFVSMSTAISPHNVVDRSKSPGFIAIQNARKNIFYLMTADASSVWDDNRDCTELAHDGSHIFECYTPEVGSTKHRKYGELAYSGCFASSGSDYVESYVCWKADVRFEQDIRAIIELLYARLRQAFEDGQASPRDQDAYGDTLLHVRISHLS